MVKDKKILITGGLGFVGFNAVLHFSKNNRVCVIDDCSRVGVDHNVEQLEELKIEFHCLDISHSKELREVYYAFQPDIVVHMAAQVAVTLSISNPVRDYNSNIQGSFNLLELARTSNKKPILLYASTNKVYGSSSQDIIMKEGRYSTSNDMCYSEEVQLSFETPYGCSKGAADQYFVDYARTYGIPSVVFRQSCIYGPHQYGMEDQGWVAWFAICSAFSEAITIFGDGNQVRDVLYIDDLINLYEKAILNIDSIKGEVFNIGGGPSKTLSLNELVAILSKKTGKPLEVSYADWRLGDQKVYVSDVGKVERLLGWRPQTNPVDGVEKLLDWISKERETIDYVKQKQLEGNQLCDVSIVLPARNEEACIPFVLDELDKVIRSSSYSIEVIVVNDRSTDKTADIARQYSFVKLIENKHNQGKGGALRTGFAETRGTYIVMMDADFSHRAYDLPDMVDTVRRCNGLVIASRVTGDSEEYNKLRAFGNYFLTWVFGFLHGRYLSDALNGFKVFHRDVYFEFEYTSKAFEIEIELLVNTLRLKRKILEIPSGERERLAGKMKSSVIKHGSLFFWRSIFEYFRNPKRKDVN